MSDKNNYVLFPDRSFLYSEMIIRNLERYPWYSGYPGIEGAHNLKSLRCADDTVEIIENKKNPAR